MGLQSHRAIDPDQETSQPADVQDEKYHGAEERAKRDMANYVAGL